MRRIRTAVITIALLCVGAQPALAQDGATDGEESPWWLLLVVLGAVVLIGTTLVVAGRGRRLRVAVSDPGWKPRAREAFAQGRWLADAMGEDLAIWRGERSDVEAGSAHAATWEQLGGRYDRARDALYGLEATAPDATTARTARTAAAALIACRQALDARAQARQHTIEIEGGSTEGSLPAARDREVRAGQQLTAAHRDLEAALGALSTLA